VHQRIRHALRRIGSRRTLWISSQSTSGLQICQTSIPWTIMSGGDVGGSIQNQSQSLNSSKRCRWSWAAFHRNQSTRLSNAFQNDWKNAWKLEVDISNTWSECKCLTNRSLWRLSAACVSVRTFLSAWKQRGHLCKMSITINWMFAKLFNHYFMLMIKMMNNGVKFHVEILSNCWKNANNFRAVNFCRTLYVHCTHCWV